MEMIGYAIIIGIALILLIAISIFIISRMKGKILIVLNNYNYSPGEAITGQVILKLKKPIDVYGLNIRLIGERRNTSYSRSAGNNHQSGTSIIFDFAQPIDGQKFYPAGEQTYNFSIKIPRNVLTNLSGVAEVFLKSALILSGKNSVVKWYLISTLDAKGVNVKSKKVQINIG